MLRNAFLAAAVAVLLTLLTATDARAWGIRHVGYTHIGPYGAYHVGGTAVGGYHYGYGAYGYHPYGYAAYGYHPYGYAYGYHPYGYGYAGGYRYGAEGAYRAGVYRW
jgi:hypothetical protein